MTFELELWACTKVTIGSAEPCNRSVYLEPGSSKPTCPHVPEIGPRHGKDGMVSMGLFEFEQMEFEDATSSR